MKTILAAIAILSSPLAQADITNSPGGGCTWQGTTGSCMYANVTKKPITCDLRIQVTTERNQKTTKVSGAVIEVGAAYSQTFRAVWDDKIERAQIAARCK